MAMRNYNAKPRRETTTLNKNLLYLSNTISTLYEARNDAIIILSNIYRRDFGCLSIQNHDANQKPFISFYYYDNVIQSRGRCHDYIKSME